MWSSASTPTARRTSTDTKKAGTHFKSDGYIDDSENAKPELAAHLFVLRLARAPTSFRALPRWLGRCVVRRGRRIGALGRRRAASAGRQRQVRALRVEIGDDVGAVLRVAS